jgi:hypothetical protein
MPRIKPEKANMTIISISMPERPRNEKPLYLLQNWDTYDL